MNSFLFQLWFQSFLIYFGDHHGIIVHKVRGHRNGCTQWRQSAIGLQSSRHNCCKGYCQWTSYLLHLLTSRRIKRLINPRKYYRFSNFHLINITLSPVCYSLEILIWMSVTLVCCLMRLNWSGPSDDVVKTEAAYRNSDGTIKTPPPHLQRL